MSGCTAMASHLRETQGLKHEPVAIALMRKGGPLAGQSPGDREAGKPYGKAISAREGERLLAIPDKEACSVGASALGIAPVPEKVAL